MEITMKLIRDSEGNKYNNFNEISNYNENFDGLNLSNFEILQVLSEDNDPNLVGKVRSLKNNKIYALKQFIIPMKLNINNIFRIIDIIKSLNHPNIIKYYHYFHYFSKDGNIYLYIIMEYVNNSDIIKYLKAHKELGKRIPESEIWNNLLQCTSALEYLNNINNINKINLEIKNIIINNEQNAKIGINFGFIYNLNNYLNSLPILWKYFYIILESEIINNIEQISIYNINRYNQISNMNYSQALKNIINNIPNNFQLYQTVKNTYSSINYKNTSIKAVLECLNSYKNINDEIKKQMNLFENNSQNYYINYLYLQSLKSLYNKNMQNLKYCLEEFRIAMASSYSKLIFQNEIDPIFFLTFLLDRMHNENNKAKKRKKNKSGNEKNIDNEIISDFTGEEDKSNEMQMLDKYVSCFNSSMNSPISDLFLGFIKIERKCQKCHSVLYCFSNYLYLIFDLSKKYNQNFDLIEDGFKAQNNSIKIIDADDPKKIFCECCLDYQTIHEKNKFYMLNQHLIICFTRGKNYQNNSKIIFNENINLKEYVQPGTSQNFHLIGSVNRIINNQGEEEFISYSNVPLNNGIGQIIMLFYNSIDGINS